MPSARGLVRHADGTARCWWPGEDPLYVRYHDEEWGTPVVRRPPSVREDLPRGIPGGFELADNPSQASALPRRHLLTSMSVVLLASVRETSPACWATPASCVISGKIESAINNARRASDLRDECGSLAAYFWRWEPDPASRPRRVTRDALSQRPHTPESSGAQQGSQEARLDVRRADDSLCVHAGNGTGERSRRGLRQPDHRRTRAVGLAPAAAPLGKASQLGRGGPSRLCHALAIWSASIRMSPFRSSCNTSM